MLNYGKVKKYLEELIKKDVAYYASEGIQNTTVKVEGGSFGSCWVTLECGEVSTGSVYVGNYKAVDKLFYKFVNSLYNNCANKIYMKYKKEVKKERNYKLEIYCNNKLVNTLSSADPLAVHEELNKILIAEKVRLVKTRWQHVPYTNDLKVTQYFPNVAEGSSYKYAYYFKNIENI